MGVSAWKRLKQQWVRLLSCFFMATMMVGNGLADETRVVNGKRYVWVPGSFTHPEAQSIARSRGGYGVVFNTMTEHSTVVGAFGFSRIAPCHTGHYQLSNGAEPQMGWVTTNGSRSARLSNLFNSDGPDDGIRNKWGYMTDDGTTYFFYGPGVGKNEDAGVIWHDNGGKLEDVSVNHRGGVLIEFD
jgi:hypothetical protein